MFKRGQVIKRKIKYPETIGLNTGAYHFGIYDGCGGVYHLQGDTIEDARVQYAWYEEFTKGQTVYPASSVIIHYSGDEIIERAQSKLGEGNYDLIFNNCEHFATWCVNGSAYSRQTGMGIARYDNLIEYFIERPGNKFIEKGDEIVEDICATLDKMGDFCDKVEENIKAFFNIF